MVLDIPPQIEERVVCSIAAAEKYAIPANILLAVAEQEGGRPGQWVRNSNGTYDVGPMQFNTAYLRTLEPSGILPLHVEGPGCYPYDLAAWRIGRHILEDKGDLWTRVSNYHSRTPSYNHRYRTLLMRRATRWSHWLAERFPVVDAMAVRAHPDVNTPGEPGR